MSLSEEVIFPEIVGGIPVLEGDPTTPANITLTGTASTIGTMLQVTGNWYFIGITIKTTGTLLRGIEVTFGGRLKINNIRIDNITSHAIVCELNGVIDGKNASIVRAGAVTSAVFIALLGGAINLLGATLNMTAGSATHEYRVLLNGIIDMFGATRTGGVVENIATGGQIRTP